MVKLFKNKLGHCPRYIHMFFKSQMQTIYWPWKLLSSWVCRHLFCFFSSETSKLRMTGLGEQHHLLQNDIVLLFKVCLTNAHFRQWPLPLDVYYEWIENTVPLVCCECTLFTSEVFVYTWPVMSDLTWWCAVELPVDHSREWTGGGGGTQWIR